MFMFIARVKGPGQGQVRSGNSESRIFNTYHTICSVLLISVTIRWVTTTPRFKHADFDQLLL